ncbi:MAG: hypothetical protein QM740_20075 [Acidovorax sp.]
MSEIPYETLKDRAKRALDARIARCDPWRGGIGFDDGTAAHMLLPYALLGDEERAALMAPARTCADASPLEQRARAPAQAGQTDGSQWLIRVRRTGHRVIDGWDVRCVAHLIAHLPKCVTVRQRRSAITCRDDARGAWIVAFTDNAPAKELRP